MFLWIPVPDLGEAVMQAVIQAVIDEQSQGGESRHEFVAENERSLTQWVEVRRS